MYTSGVGQFEITKKGIYFMNIVFTKKVLEIVGKIPKGKTLSYKEVAARAGNTGAARVVGNIMRRNYDLKIPCHRVIKSDGTPGDYNRGGKKTKARLLREEQAF